jgi:UDP-glucose 4-epimerase
MKNDKEIKSVLVTGANGFIGGHVVDMLLEEGYEVGVFDRNLNNKNDYDERCKLYFGDTRDYETISEAISKHDGVIHLAGILGTQETVDKPIPSVNTNIIGGLNVFQGCRFYKKKCVYIAVGNHWMNNSYSITKTTTERFALMYNKEHGTKIAVVRGLNVYGERQKAKPVRKIMPNFILPALNNEDILIYGSGEQRMDMIYVKDVARVLINALVIEHDVYDRTFEAGLGIAPTVNDIAKTVIRLCNSTSKLNHTDMRAGEEKISVVIGNPKTLIPILGEDYPFVSMEEGIKKSIEWYK